MTVSHSPTRCLYEVPEASFAGANRWTVENGQEYVVIENLESFEAFFLNIVTAGEQWLFCSSGGALSAGRRSPETALFPYCTVDKIIDNWNSTGPYTGIVSAGQLWTPFTPPVAHLAPIQRRLLKSLLGDEVVFDELHEGLGLRMTYRWQLSDEYGFVRKATLTNEGSAPCDLRMVDGLDNFLPPGVGNRMQQSYSCLADAYKLSELECGSSLMVHRLAAGIVDEPIPLESLRATTVWTDGLGEGPAYLKRRDAEKFLQGKTPDSPDRVRANRGAFLLAREMALAPGESREWIMVAEVEQTQAEVEALRQELANPAALCAEVEKNLQKGRDRLHEIVASSDGFQETADRDYALYHYQNTLCNILRGGVPEQGSLLRREQLIHHLKVHQAPLCTKHADFLKALPEVIARPALISRIGETGDLDLLRLAEEYLPLILSRRHGDPSRPWNRFNILLHDEDGQPMHHYEGNWRDIFQNWEALAWSYPDFLGGFISKFLNASTIDGYNPYRITSSGVDWESPDEDDPWVSIGYWGDHQIIYLLKLLELEAKMNPERLAERLDSPAYVYADVPYRFKPWEDILSDPRDTIIFDQERHEELLARKEKIGVDGLLLRDKSGELVRATLAEKMLLPAVIKLANLVPGGGVWLNTQKPEWNDANNALAGSGLSVVTAGYLLRYLEFLGAQLRGARISAPLARLIEGLLDLFRDARWQNQAGLSAEDRFTLVEASGRLAESYRAEIPGENAVQLTEKTLADFLASARAAVAGLLRLNERPDGLFHAYNVLDIRKDERAMGIKYLPLMLEGQVAILSSGMLSPDEAVALLEKMARSDLRSSKHPTYLLYPDRELPRFLEKNLFTAEQLAKVPALKNSDLIVSDPGGGFRFVDSLVNGYALGDALAEMTELSAGDRRGIEELYEDVFEHQSFTGRSGSMFGYEGLGCVYWHMVSKLMLAAQEVTLSAVKEGADDELIKRFFTAYYAIQRGLGFRQSPEQFGAFPAEPYSHSSGQAGAQQPGLTGQVKEGILCRFGELGVDFEAGRLHFKPRLLRAAEFAGLSEGPDREALPQGTISFTIARTPVTYRSIEELAAASAVVHLIDGSQVSAPEGRLDRETTLEILGQTGKVRRVEVQVPAQWLIA